MTPKASAPSAEVDTVSAGKVDTSASPRGLALSVARLASALQQGPVAMRPTRRPPDRLLRTDMGIALALVMGMFALWTFVGIIATP